MAAVGSAFPRRPLSPRLWVLLFAAGACLAIFFATIAWVFEGASVVSPAAADFDRSISLALARFREGGPTGRVVEISALGSAPVLAIFAIVVYSLILRSRDWLGFAHLTTTLLGASVLSRLLQHVWDRARPETLLSYIVVTKGSFPSAHLFGAAACYFTFAFFYARYAGGRATEIAVHGLTALLVVLIGSTRVYLGAHHTTDVIAGIAGGWAWGLLVATLFSLWYRPAPR
jgi:undecaprenyl-diphosphatase